ncbi:MAG: hypothetical protein ACM3SU_05265 [Acidobacteriota bacterium]
MTARRRLLALALAAAVAAPLAGAGACRKKPPEGKAPPGFERRPYTPIAPPPTRTLKPGEPTPLPRLPE